jgi:hypothetical protein
MRLVTIAYLTAACASACAQESVTSASVGGRVTDGSGAPIESAQVSAKQLDTNLTSAAATDREGRFHFAYLRLGQYEIAIRRTGFADAKRTLTLTVGAAFELPVTLTVGDLDQHIVVSADATVLEAAQ